MRKVLVKNSFFIGLIFMFLFGTISIYSTNNIYNKNNSINVKGTSSTYNTLRSNVNTLKGKTVYLKKKRYLY